MPKPDGEPEIFVDVNSRDQVVIGIDTDHRSTLSMRPELALELHRLLTEFFGEYELAPRSGRRRGFWSTLLGGHRGARD